MCLWKYFPLTLKNLHLKLQRGQQCWMFSYKNDINVIIQPVLNNTWGNTHQALCFTFSGTADHCDTRGYTGAPLSSKRRCYLWSGNVLLHPRAEIQIACSRTRVSHLQAFRQNGACRIASRGKEKVESAFKRAFLAGMSSFLLRRCVPSLLPSPSSTCQRLAASPTLPAGLVPGIPDKGFGQNQSLLFKLV